MVLVWERFSVPNGTLRQRERPAMETRTLALAAALVALAACTEDGPASIIEVEPEVFDTETAIYDGLPPITFPPCPPWNPCNLPKPCDPNAPQEAGNDESNPCPPRSTQPPPPPPAWLVEFCIEEVKPACRDCDEVFDPESEACAICDKWRKPCESVVQASGG